MTSQKKTREKLVGASLTCIKSVLFIYFMWFLANIFVQDGDTSEVSSKQLTCLVKELKGRIEVIFFH